MKRLYENIEDIHIKGSISQLSQLVTNLDLNLQDISNKTDELYNWLVKFSGSNAGRQFEKVVEESLSLRDYLYDAATDINQMQNDIAAYQNKIARFEDNNEYADAPNPLMLSKNKHVNVKTDKVEIKKNEMNQLLRALKAYRSYIDKNAKEIDRKSREIGVVWQDSQYKDFMNYIHDIFRRINECIKKFEPCIQELEEKIKGLE